MFRSYQHSIEHGEISITQKQGVISLLPKGNKPREFLTNWRPISLLNISYKLLSGCYAQRTKLVLDNIIHENQKGFIKGRFIGENIRLLYDLMHHLDENEMPGLLLLVDFQKAFDSISWKYIYKCLEFFNFGPKYQKIIHMLYRNANLCVIQHGVFSEFFPIGRGCRQGDPISPYLFIICAEILGILIRNNKNTKGINIGEINYKLFLH